VEAALKQIEISMNFPDSEQLVYGLNLLIELIPQLQQLDNVLLNKSLDTLHCNFDVVENKQIIAVKLFRLGVQLKMNNRFQESLKSFLIVADYHEEVEGHKKLINTLMDLRELFLEQGHVDNAQKAYNKVILIRESIENP
jgi:soluble cytochrome b562